jgi:hypothetical protein
MTLTTVVPMQMVSTKRYFTRIWILQQNLFLVEYELNMEICILYICIVTNFLSLNNIYFLKQQ